MIFLSYRRSDAAGWAGRLYDRLATELGESRLFMDVDSIAPGENFVEVLEAHVANCDVLLVLIGNSWLSAVDDVGTRRLDSPNDFAESKSSPPCRLGKRVIPVLLNGASMPRTVQLPEVLHDLALRNAVVVSHENFGSDVRRLIGILGDALQKAKTERQEAESELHSVARLPGDVKRYRLRVAVLAVAVFIGIAGSVILTGGTDSGIERPRKSSTRAFSGGEIDQQGADETSAQSRVSQIEQRCEIDALY